MTHINSIITYHDLKQSGVVKNMCDGVIHVMKSVGVPVCVQDLCIVHGFKYESVSPRFAELVNEGRITCVDEHGISAHTGRHVCFYTVNDSPAPRIVIKKKSKTEVLKEELVAVMSDFSKFREAVIRAASALENGSVDNTVSAARMLRDILSSS